MEKLTKELATRQFERIESAMGDNEIAHSLEDKLNNWFNECLKENMYDTIEEITEIAKIMCDVSKLEFTRWHG